MLKGEKRQSWRAPCNTLTACGNRWATASSDSAAPLGLPGRFTMSVLCRTAAAPRERMAVGVCSNPLRRISSEIPGTIRSATACVASGVLSRGPMPVPPVVSTTSTRPESASSRNCSRIPAGSSEIRNDTVTSQPSPRQAATTAGPEASSRSPLATVSLMERTATLMRRDCGEISRRRHRLVAVGFVHQPHCFHQQACSVFGGRCARRSVRGVEVNLKIPGGPQHYLVHGVVAFHFAHFGVAALPACIIEFSLHAVAVDDQPARLVPPLQRLHQVDHAHLFQAPLNGALARRPLLQLLRMQPVNDLLR